MTRRRFNKRDLEKRLKEVFGGECAMCRCQINGASGLEWDHMIPLAIGGEDELSNLQPLCARDHRLKTKGDVSRIAKTTRQRQAHLRIKDPNRRRIPSPPKAPKRPTRQLPPRRQLYEDMR